MFAESDMPINLLSGVGAFEVKTRVLWKQIVTKIQMKMHLPKCFFILRMWLHYLTHKWIRMQSYLHLHCLLQHCTFYTIICCAAQNAFAFSCSTCKEPHNSTTKKHFESDVSSRSFSAPCWLSYPSCSVGGGVHIITYTYTSHITLQMCREIDWIAGSLTHHRLWRSLKLCKQELAEQVESNNIAESDARDRV